MTPDRPGPGVVRGLDAATVTGTPLTERLVQRLVGAADGTGSCTISWVRTPPASGSPEGLHVHPVDQIFYLLEGTMTIEVRGERQRVEPGSVVLFPAGVAHRNWNDGAEPTIHLSINAPAPPADVPFVQRVERT